MKEGGGGGEGRAVGGGGRARKDTSPPPPPLALLLQHTHALMTLAPRSLLRNRTETLATQATYL